jgi:hypothetical protein
VRFASELNDCWASVIHRGARRQRMSSSSNGHVAARRGRGQRSRALGPCDGRLFGGCANIKTQTINDVCARISRGFLGVNRPSSGCFFLSEATKSDAGGNVTGAPLRRGKQNESARGNYCAGERNIRKNIQKRANFCGTPDSQRRLTKMRGGCSHRRKLKTSYPILASTTLSAVNGRRTSRRRNCLADIQERHTIE